MAVPIIFFTIIEEQNQLVVTVMFIVTYMIVLAVTVMYIVTYMSVFASQNIVFFLYSGRKIFSNREPKKSFPTDPV